MTSGTKTPAQELYHAYMARVYRNEFGVLDPKMHAAVANDWFYCDDRHDQHFETLRERLPKAKRILDLASGMGSAVLHGLQQDLDVFGVEPDSEKLALMQARINEGIAREGWSPEWKGRFLRAVGESLPFQDKSFDIVLSYQTLEHVQDSEAVISEMLRVVRPGGALHLRCPDYSGTFEGHYLLPWLPLLPRSIAKIWLRLNGRPLLGFEGIRYITKNQIRRLLKKAAGRAGISLTIIDLEQERYEQRLKEKGVPGWQGPALPWRVFYYLKRMFRTELQVNLWVTLS